MNKQTVHHDFKPGDRVRWRNGKELVVGEVSPTSPALSPNEWSEGASLVSRPVYPEPGQVVVALDEGAHARLVGLLHTIGKHSLDGLWRAEANRALAALGRGERAREQSS